jgi:hypothetical protein
MNDNLTPPHWGSEDLGTGQWVDVDPESVIRAKDAELTRLRAKIEAADKLAEALKVHRKGPGGLPSAVFDALSAYGSAGE